MYLVEGEKATTMQQLLKMIEEKAIEVNDPNFVPRVEENLDIFQQDLKCMPYKVPDGLNGVLVVNGHDKTYQPVGHSYKSEEQIEEETRKDMAQVARNEMEDLPLNDSNARGSKRAAMEKLAQIRLRKHDLKSKRNKKMMNHPEKTRESKSPTETKKLSKYML